jgi:hypothetical protein
MTDIPYPNLLSEIANRATQEANDEFIKKSIRLYKQEQAHKQQGDIKASSAEMPRRTESTVSDS